MKPLLDPMQTVPQTPTDLPQLLEDLNLVLSGLVKVEWMLGEQGPV